MKQLRVDYGAGRVFSLLEILYSTIAASCSILPILLAPVELNKRRKQPHIQFNSGCMRQYGVLCIQAHQALQPFGRALSTIKSESL